MMTALIYLLTAATLSGPLAPAADGQVQCFNPDVGAKTCSAIAAFRVAPDGNLILDERTWLAFDPPVVMHTVTSGKIRGDAVCTTPRPRDIDEASFTSAGALVEAHERSLLRPKVLAAFGRIMNRVTCTTYVAQADGIIATQTTESAPAVPTSQRMIWIAPDAGFDVRR